jgi:carbonic anhydrase
MAVFEEFDRANQAYAARYAGPASKLPQRHVAVIACMDARLDLPGALGLDLGQAHLLRNGGGLVTDDVVRSLAISQRHLGTRSVLVIHHTDCGMTGFDDAGFRSELAAESGRTPGWDVPGFTDIEAQVRDSVAALRACPWLPHRDDVHGAVYDVTTGRISEVG